VPAPAPAPDSAGAPAAPATQAAGATDKPAEPELVVKQIFVQTGRRSGDQIEILNGVEPGMKIVTSGQNKLSNGSKVAIDNSISLSSEQTSVQ
jgi:membrane fusion protein (multidrug efflux system)